MTPAQILVLKILAAFGVLLLILVGAFIWDRRLTAAERREMQRIYRRQPWSDSE